VTPNVSSNVGIFTSHPLKNVCHAVGPPRPKLTAAQ